MNKLILNKPLFLQICSDFSHCTNVMNLNFNAEEQQVFISGKNQDINTSLYYKLTDSCILEKNIITSFSCDFDLNHMYDLIKSIPKTSTIEMEVNEKKLLFKQDKHKINIQLLSYKTELNKLPNYKGDKLFSLNYQMIEQIFKNTVKCLNNSPKGIYDVIQLQYTQNKTDDLSYLLFSVSDTFRLIEGKFLIDESIIKECTIRISRDNFIILNKLRKNIDIFQKTNKELYILCNDDYIIEMQNYADLNIPSMSQILKLQSDLVNYNQIEFNTKDINELTSIYKISKNNEEIQNCEVSLNNEEMQFVSNTEISEGSAILNIKRLNGNQNNNFQCNTKFFIEIAEIFQSDQIKIYFVFSSEKKILFFESISDNISVILLAT